MQVDSTLMNVEDGGTVSRVTSAPNKVTTTMVGNPPQTLPPEFRGDVTFSQQNKTTAARNAKAPKASLDTCNFNHGTGLSPLQHPNNAPVACSTLMVTDKRSDIPKAKAENTGAFSAPQWSGSESLNLCRSSMTSSHKSKTQMQSVQSAPPGFHCSTIFKPTQSVAFIPSPNYSSLCKITLPPALGQIAALREATASQFQKKIQPRSSGVSGTPLMRTYPYPFTVGRASASEKKIDTCSSKNKSSHLSNKNSKSIDGRSLPSVVASPAMTLPVQHPSLTSIAPTHYTLSPTAAICCGSALANLASQGRLLNHMDKSKSIDMTTITSLNSSVPATSEDQTTLSSSESRDVPLDLSAKSKRPKSTNEPQSSPPGSFKDESNSKDFVNSKRTYSSMFSSSVQYPLLPNTQRNGSHQKQLRSPHCLDNKPLWPKGSSQDPIKNIPGTYVGVASPILASTLRGKDGKGTFADELQSFAKQEFISIIDQGEYLGEHKASLKSNQHALKHVKNTSTKIPVKCSSKGAQRSDQSNSTGQQLEEIPLQSLTLQSGITSASPKTKNPPATDESKNSGFNSPKSDEDSWERIKSPLSNLASIVKSHDVATFVEGNATSVTAVPSKSNSVASKQTLESPPLWSVEKWSPTTSQKDLTNLAKVVKRIDKTNVIEPVDDTRNMQCSQAEHRPHVKQSCLKPTIKSNVSASSNGTRRESKLAQVLEGEILKQDGGSSDNTAPGKLVGVVASDAKDYCATGGNSLARKSNGVKEMSPTTTKAAPVKQKTPSPRKSVKIKSPVVSSEKTTGNAKLQVHSEASPKKVSPVKKKKQSGPILQQSLLADKLSQHQDDVPPDKTTPKKVEKSVSKAEKNFSQILKSPRLSKQTETAEELFPRLRRGRRRADESRLDLWGFATPSPPPSPPSPVPSPSSSPPSTAPQAARRPRGRPRSTPRPQRGLQRKDSDCPIDKKRQRCKNKKYQTGDYVTDKVKLEDGACPDESEELSQDHTADSQKNQRLPLAPSPEPLPQRPASTRSASVCYQDSEGSTEGTDKPSGKRKFKSKHLCASDEPKIKSKRNLGKRSVSRAPDDDSYEAKKAASPPASPKSFRTSFGPSGKISGSDSHAKRPVPPEVRRLIVNKNAGETLLQRAARLGYQDVVQYCLEKDIREVNRRDNAGYTALHEASSRGWVQIVQMLLKNGADVNCSAQDGTRPIHDAVASDNLEIVWLLLNHGADPTLATYSGQTPVKLAQSSSMKVFLSEYFNDLQGRSEHDPGLHWDFYSSSLFETEQEPCWDFLLSEQNQDVEQDPGVKSERDPDKDCLVFEFSSEPLLPCYHVQVSLTKGFCNWLLLADVLKRMKMSARIFKARYPHLEVVSLPYAELVKQVSVSQVSPALASVQKDKNKETEDDEEEDEGEEGHVELVRCVPELQRLLGSSIHILRDDQEEEEPKEDKASNTGRLRSR